jgi:hypothetical protein
MQSYKKAWYIREPRIEVVEIDEEGNPIRIAFLYERQIDEETMVRTDTEEGQILKEQLLHQTGEE